MSGKDRHVGQTRVQRGSFFHVLGISIGIPTNPLGVSGVSSTHLEQWQESETGRTSHPLQGALAHYDRSPPYTTSALKSSLSPPECGTPIRSEPLALGYLAFSPPPISAGTRAVNPM